MAVPSAAPRLAPGQIHARIGAAWPSVLQQRLGELPSKRKPGPCPACGGTDRFFYDNRRGRGDFFCRQCGAGDGFDLLMRAHGWTFAEARQHVLTAADIEQDASTAPVRTSAPTAPPRTYRPWRDLAAYLWDQSQPIAGTIVQTYLEHRGCRLPPEDGDLRYLPARGEYPAAMLGRVTDAITGEPISLHITRLAPDGSGKAGTDRDKLLLAGHRKQGGVIRLWPDEAVTHGLAITEGIESALAAAHVYTPVWAAIDAGNLSQLPVLAGVEALTIVADHDDAGIRAARECARRWAAAGHEVRIAMSSTTGQDVADVGAAA